MKQPKRYDLAIYIGRFQPFHLGHLHVLEQAKKIADRTIVLVGSSFRPRTIKNPFTFEERRDMIHGAAQAVDSKVTVVPLRDFIYRDDLWAQHVQERVDRYVKSLSRGRYSDIKVALIGHDKDHSSWYLKEFPQWDLVETESYQGLSATPIRDSMLSLPFEFGEWMAKAPLARALPASTISAMTDFFDEALAGPREELDYVTKYKASWDAAPYAPTFNTVDAVVVQQGHILLVERGDMPGKGLWALPGGFLDPNETLIDAAVRELVEETHLKVPARFLKQLWMNNPAMSRTFDAPGRSSRGRTLTTAFYAPLDTPKDGQLPEVRGGDDAAKAFWVPLSAVKSSMMFEDHFDIIDWFVPLDGGLA